ncbi:MAG: hypothetical protein OEL84_02640 [Nitrosopumilus sp.]|nr:hypothetical protein [Nitrosopumilus sp.]
MDLFEIASVMAITVGGIFFVGCAGIIVLGKIGIWDRPQDVKHQEAQ